MLEIQGCLVLRAFLNRPNLYYEVRRKPTAKQLYVEMIENLLKWKFEGKSGIIYTRLVGCYHALLEADVTTKIYSKWSSGEYQAVVATIAFGLEIDKPDVTFFIHHCLYVVR